MLFTISTIIFFFIAIIISQFILDPNLRIAYWLMLLLIYISWANIYMSSYFYIKLREQPGLQGARGPPGETGPKGSKGVCQIEPECGIQKNKLGDIIRDEIRNLDSNYSKIINKEKNGIMLKDNEEKIKSSIEDYILKVQQKATDQNMSRNDIKKELKLTFN